MYLFAALALSATPSVPSATKPHILFVLIDDFGHAEMGYHRDPPTREVQTPNMDQLALEGVKLERHYVHKFCSPTRCAIQSGRAPVHVNVINASPDVSNPADPVAGFAAIPRNMTGIAEVLRGAGYSTHIAGKWDAGMATPDHTPAGRGYDTSLIYYHHANDYWTFTIGNNKTGPKDLWNCYNQCDAQYGYPGVGQGAHNKVNGAGCTQAHQSATNPSQQCTYEDALFEDRMTHIIKNHTGDKPLFLFWSTHIVHGPLQVPQATLDNFTSFIPDLRRATYHSMVHWIDGAIGRVTRLMKEQGLWENTLMVLSADNGGPIGGGSNNYPFRGGKFSNWEGGIRVNAFMSGGFVPPHARGTIQTGLVAGWDWYATFAGLAGADPTDHRAAAAGLPPIDSIDVWPLVSSGVNGTSPRTKLVIGSNVGGDSSGRTSANTTIGGIIIMPYKILLGYGDGFTIDYAGWTGPQNPNKTGSSKWTNITQVCGRTAATGCLYDIVNDPYEHHNLAAAQPRDWERLYAIAMEEQKTVFSPQRGEKDPKAAEAVERYGGFWGPFLP